jgi:hypothetical protein
MKQLLSMVVIAGTLTIMFSSCAKEEPWHASALISQPGDPSPTQTSANFELVANNWVNPGGELYTNTFKGLIASANASGNHKVTVFLQGNGGQIQISQVAPVTYMGHELWAINSQADVSIIYRCNGKLPFTSLSIRVQVN